MNRKTQTSEKSETCTEHLRAIHDTMDVLNGKWKIAIIGSLRFGKRRFMELQREVEGVGSKMLSKELRELEMNELVRRTVYDTKPVTVEYELTDYGKTLESIIDEMAKWGHSHRKRIMHPVNQLDLQDALSHL
ncbi:winged helix-turn-helix transcriptional regulator [Chitinophaga pinensis]|uniref:Transcriptional regulator, HxlR family n=1 Tax=Chitinophaga pinensis (strain ATCC 43595 / DSM 2588 / LMG 13176 / NBRC 15968 / NCIMB 11800 / UQM 2034) TaxID=485918 RepID=A0A979G872_CHIPD|nr:helix-turn-helix domain-containing protein [Chitinophaga pinensis]ACU62432.1 transcriptional regulator, HxlR family [Chitinophaga pinensis DSM 2588]